MDKSARMPDMSSHSNPITVGMAISELAKCGISPKQIRFNIVNKHSSLGEIVSQNPAPGTPISSIDEVVLAINSWSDHNGRRFSFFEAEELLKIERELDEWQQEDWADYKNFIVHLFARMDNIGELSHDHLLEQYFFRRVVPLHLDGFRHLNKINSEIKQSDLLEPGQWKVLFHDIQKAAVTTITLSGLTAIIAKYLRMDANNISCKLVNDKYQIIIEKDEKNDSDILLVKWLDYLFRPLYMQVEYKWKRIYKIPKLDSVRHLKNIFPWLSAKKKPLLAFLLTVFVLISFLLLYLMISENDGQILPIEFSFGKSEIKPKYYPVINKICDYMEKNPKKIAIIEGHTDGVGDRINNIYLSIKRAESVRYYLINKCGISPSRIKASGYGPDRPLVKGNTPKDRQKNRRVVVKYDH